MSSRSQSCLIESSRATVFSELKHSTRRALYDRDITWTEPTLSDIATGPRFNDPFERVGRLNAVVLHDSEVSPGWSLSTSVDSVVSATDDGDYDDLVESILRMQICPYMTRDIYINVAHSYELMVRVLSRGSEELKLVNDMNHPNHRTDPWNPAPYLLCTFDRDESDVYSCFEQLTPYNKPPFRTVEHYIDFFGQLLEGLTFLHELSIVNLNCAKPSSFMIDLSAGSSSTSAEGPASLILSASQPVVPSKLPEATQPFKTIVAQDTALEGCSFDRAKFPVKYYIVDYSDALQLSSDRSASRPLVTSPLYKSDVRDLGTFFSNVLDDVPELNSNFRPLVSAMITGELTADDTRKLFEALRHSIASSVFNVSVPPRRPATPSRTQSSPSNFGSSLEISEISYS